MDSDLVKAFIAGQVRHVLTGAAGALVAHAAIKGDQANAFVEVGSSLVLYAIGALWSWWQKNGQAAMKAKLDRVSGHVQAINTSAPPGQVAAAVETAKRVAAVMVIGFALGWLLAPQAHAQGRPQITGNIVNDTRANLGLPGAGNVSTTKATPDLITKIQQVAVADLKTASADAKATGDTVAAPCYDAWITLIEAQQAAQASAPSDPSVPHVITTFQRDRDLVNALRPGSPMKVACAPLAEELKQDVMTLLSKIAGGVLTVPLMLAPFGL